MIKSEMVTKLQDILKELKIVTQGLDRNISSLKDFLEKQEFIPNVLGESIRDDLEKIKEKQSEFIFEYKALELPELSENYTILENNLLEFKKVIGEKEKYIEAIKFFLRIHSKDKETEQLLEKHKQYIEQHNIGSLESEELQKFSEPYKWVYDAYLEQDSKKKFSLIYKLSSYFEEEIVSGLNFDTFEISEEGAEEGKEGVLEKAEDKQAETIEKTVAVTDEAVEATSKQMENSILDDTEQKEILIKENFSLLYPQDSKKAKSKFGVKEFKKDIVKQLRDEKLYCMVEAVENSGYTIKSITIKKNDEKGMLKLATEKLYQLGYLTRYVVDGIGEFFTLSSRGEKAFISKESFAFINQYSYNTVSIKNKEDIEVTANSAITRLLYFNSVIKQRNLFPDYQFVQRNGVLGTDYFVQGYPNFEKEIITWYAGVVTEDIEQVLEFQQILADRVKEEDILIILGVTLEQAKAVAKWLLKQDTIKVKPENVCYSTCAVEEINNISTKQNILLKKKEVDIFSSEQEADITEKTEEEKIESEAEEEKIEPEAKEDNIEDTVDEGQAESADKETSETAAEEMDEEPPEQVEVDTVPVEKIKDEQPKEIMKEDLLSKQQEIAVTSVSDKVVLTDEEKKMYIDAYEQMIVQGKTYAASAYLKVLTKKYDEFAPVYCQLAYAVNDPMENCTYSSDNIFSVFYENGQDISDYFTISAAVRNYFLDQYSYDYQALQLYSTLSGNTLLKRNQSLEEIVYKLMNFKNEQHRGVDRYADYREKERGNWEKKLEKILQEAKSYHESIATGNLKEKASHKRFIETSKLLLGTKGELYEYLGVVIEDSRDPDMLDMLEEFLKENYVKDQAEICEENIDPAKINKTLDKYWELAAQNMRLVKKTSDLMSSLRMNLYKKVDKIVAVLCNYIFMMHSSSINGDDPALAEYRKLQKPLLNNIDEAIQILSETTEAKLHEQAGKMVLLQTLEELRSRLSGEYKDGSYKYYYVDFLKNDKVLLDDDFIPILDEVLELPKFSIISRIKQHCEEEEETFSDRLQQIFEGEDDYGSAALILNYMEEQGCVLSEEESKKYDIEKAVVYPLKDLDNKKKEFIEDIELAQSYGQIDNTVENSKEMIVQIMESWYGWALKTQNYGFFVKILKEFKKKIKEDARVRAVDLESSLNGYLEANVSWKEDELVNKAVAQIEDRIKQQNYAAAEDLLNRLLTNDLDVDIQIERKDYLEEFIKEYDINYRKTANAGKTLKALVDTSKSNKDIRGGNKLLESWPKGADISPVNIKKLLSALGFNIEKVDKKMIGKIESYSIVLKKPQNGRKSNYKHPIAAFGSEAEEKGFRVVYILGTADANRLIDIFKEVGNAKNTLVLLNSALTLADRRTLARKTKTDLRGKTFAVIDRVVLVYLAKHYVETAVNRMLMAVIMPFASYQPYIDKSADVMPQEIFIGRKSELEKIESPTGVNIVYGGRQLGKSALLRMAKKDINYDENGDRAILIDIKGCDYKAAAKKISEALYDEEIFKEEKITEDWNELARNIKKRLLDKEEEIPYLLLLMDEADMFIESCEDVGYQPFDALKDIQSIGSGKFKFVVAGLRNIVRFKKEVAWDDNSGLTHLGSLTVKPFKSMEARELLEVPLSYLGFRFPRDNDTEVLISTIFGTTNYFPGLLQLYCAKLIEAVQRDYARYSESETPPYNVKKDLIKKVLAEQSLQQDIREKFFITLKIGEDDYYYIIALLVAYYYHDNKLKKGCSAADLHELADTYYIGKISELTTEKLEALMEEMKELNVLQSTDGNRYRFTRYSFCQMMGTTQQIEDELEKYMGDE